MNFPFFIARRYLFSKKSTHVINVISSISVIGVAVATMALVIVLNVFNGFHDLVATLFTSFDPQLKVVPMERQAERHFFHNPLGEMQESEGHAVSK